MPPGKKSEGPSKSQLIRDFMKVNPKASAAEVVAALAAKGIKVTAGLVYMNKGRLRQAKVHRKRKARRVVRAGQKTGSTNPVALILKVKELAKEAGGMQNLKSLIGVLAE